jgi:Tfp pilus assembly protein PilV
MIALTLMLVGLLGLAGVFARGARVNRTASDQSTATAIAEQRIEQLEQQGFSYVAANYSSIDTTLPFSSLPATIKKAATTITLFNAAGAVTTINGVRAQISVTVTPINNSLGAITLVKHISKSQ